jgi:hypothetical protein
LLLLVMMEVAVMAVAMVAMVTVVYRDPHPFFHKQPLLQMAHSPPPTLLALAPFPCDAAQKSEERREEKGRQR